MRLYQSMCLYNPRWLWDKDRQIVTKWQIWSHYESLLLCLHHFGFMPWKSSPSALWGLTSLGEDRRPPWNLGQALGCKWNETLHIFLKFWYGLCSFFEREGTSNIPDPKPVIFSMKMVKMAFGVCDMFASNSKKTSYILLFQCFRGPTTINYRQKSSQVQRLFSPFGRVCMRICLQEGWEISEKREYSLNPTFGWCTFPANNPRTGRGPLICSKTAKIIKQAFLKYGNAGQR